MTLPAERPGGSGGPAGAGRVPREIRVSLLGGFALTAEGTERELPKSARRLVAMYPHVLTRDLRHLCAQIDLL